MVGLTIAQLFWTCDRLGSSKGKQMSLRCSSLSEAKNRATAVSDGALGVGPGRRGGPSARAQAGTISGAEAARAAVPTVLTNSRRETPEPGRCVGLCHGRTSLGIAGGGAMRCDRASHDRRST